MTDLAESLEQVLAQELDADDALRQAVALLAGRPEVSWAAVRFLENGQLVLGPQAGTEDPGRRASVAIAYQGAPVGELVVDGALEPAQLEQLADRLALYALLGWDTGGEPWSP